MEQNNNEEKNNLAETGAVPFGDPAPQEMQAQGDGTVSEQPTVANSDEKAQQTASTPEETEALPEQAEPATAEDVPAATAAEDASEAPDPKAEREVQNAAKAEALAAKEAEKAERERQRAQAKAEKKAKKEEKKAEKEPAKKESEDAGALPNAQKRHFCRVRTKPRSYWIRRGRRRYLRRTTGRVFRFVVAMLLGIAIAFGSLAVGVFFAVGGLTIDTLQRFGMAQDIDQYLTESGEIDLTATSILELVNDLNAVRGDLGAHTLRTLISRYGIAFPEHVLKVLPTDLFDVPLDQLLSENAATAVTEHLTVGYILQFLPQSLLHPQAIAVLSPRPLALLTNGDFGALLEGVQLGHVTGVTYDDQGNVQYLNPDCPTMQEAMARLDLGKVVNAVTKNGDMLAVIATDLGETELGPVVSGMISGAFAEQLFEGRLVKDVILLNEETGRYEISLPALTDGLVLGDAMDYIRVDGVWYLSYTDNGDSTDDVEVSAIQKVLADVSLTDLVNGSLSVEQELDGLYVGDLQNGYVRGEAITEVPDGGEDPVTVGYQWGKDGVPVSKLQNSLANIAVSTLLTGGLDMNAVLGDLYLGDLQGYVYREITDGTDGAVIGHKWYEKGEDGTETEVSAMMSALSDILLSDVLNGSLDLATVFADLKLGDAQSFTLGEDGRWYRETDDGNGGTVLEYVGAVQNSISNVPLSDVVNGNFSLASALADLYLGDAMGYWRGEAIVETPEGGEPVTVGYEWIKDNGTPEGEPVSGTKHEFANIPLTDVLEGRVDVEETMKEMTLAEALGYQKIDGVWYEEYTSEEENKPTKGILRVLADKQIKELNSTTVDGILLGDVLDFTYTDTDGDGEGDTWHDGAEPATGVLSKMAGLTVGSLSDEATVSAKIRELTLAEAMGYTEVDGVWYSTYSDDDDETNDVKLTGILATLAEKPLNEINSASIDDIVLGTALGYELRDTDADGTADTWYGKDGAPVAGMMAQMSDLKIGELSDSDKVTEKVNEVKISDVLDYTYDATEKRWEHPDGRPASGVIAHMLDLDVRVGEMENTIDDMQFGYAMGLHQKDGEWLDENDQPPTGVFAGLADIHLSSASDEIRKLQVGQLMGYTGKDTDGDGEVDTWYYDDDDATNDPVTGLTKGFAGLLVTELGSESKIAAAMQGAKLGESLGFKQADGAWYKTKEDPNGNTVADLDNPVTGLLGALADTDLGGIEAEIQDIAIGKMLDYTPVEGTWYEEYTDNDDPTDDKPVKGILAVLADSKLSNLSQNLTDLTVDDVWPASERTGILKLLTGDEKITDLNSAVTDVFAEATIGEFLEVGVISISADQQAALDAKPIFGGWRTMKFADFFSALILAATGE